MRRLALTAAALPLLACSAREVAPAADVPRYTAEQVYEATGQNHDCSTERLRYRGNGLWWCVFPYVFDERIGRLVEDFNRPE